MKRLITLLSIVLCFSLNAQPPGWNYNQPVSITNPNSVNAVNYQMKIFVNTQALISAGKMQANGNDIRFSGACSGNPFYNYWIESGINTTNTVIWVKVPLIAANSTTTILMFYGNPTATSASTIQGTFRGPNSSTDSVTGGTSGGLLVCQRGYRFSPNEPVLLTHFGKNEPSGTTRYVTLFNYNTQAILQQSLVSGPASTYSYTPITPMWLTTNQQYVLQIYGVATDGYFYTPSSQIGMGLTYYEMQYSNGGSQNTFPTTTLANYHYGYGDFLYYLTSTLAITPTYTLGGELGNIQTFVAAVCNSGNLTFTTNSTPPFQWSTGSTSSVITVAVNTTTNFFITSSTNTFMCPSITVTVSTAPPIISITSSTTNVCPGNTVNLSANGALSYTWSGGISNGQTFTPSATGGYTVTGANGCGTGSAAITVSVSPLQVPAMSSKPVSCAGDQVILSAAGATSFTWLPGPVLAASLSINPTSTISYTVLGSTSVCTGSSTIQQSVNANPVIIIAASSPSICEGKTATITASGGINYTWTPPMGNVATITVAPGTSTVYSVIGDNSAGCTALNAQAITVKPQPTIGITANRLSICEGTTVQLTALGADTYVWEPSGTGKVVNYTLTQSTTFTATGTNSTTQCEGQKTISINVFTVALPVSGPTAVCLGQSVTIWASGAKTYTWGPNDHSSSLIVSPTQSTVYTVAAHTQTIGMTCPVSNTIPVTVNSLPVVTITTNRKEMCAKESLTLTAGGANNYLWSTSATSSVIVYKPNNPTTGNFTVTGTDGNGCANTATYSLKVVACTGIVEAPFKTGVSIFPNPSTGLFKIVCEKEGEVTLSDELGRLLGTYMIKNENNLSLEIKIEKPGIYFVRGQTDEGIFEEKIVITK